MNGNRLNNAIRDIFINDVMADVPTVDYEEKIRDAVTNAAKAALPPQIKKLLADENLAKFLSIASLTLNYRHGLPNGAYVSFRIPGESHTWLESIAVSASTELAKLWCEQEETKDALRSKLRAVAYHCTTRKQLLEAFPEFAEYLPADEQDAMRNLPALANVVADFVNAGWPKDKGVRK